MHIYRYRAPGLLSQKGVLYDEWYFASKDELNDPIEMQSRFEFPENSTDIWHRVLRILWEGDASIKCAAEYLSRISPIPYEQIIKNFELHSNNIIGEIFKNRQITLPDLNRTKHNLNKLKDFLLLYEPSGGYSISFSKTSNEMLLWSHYAASHTGYCLIFRPIEGYLQQCPARKKDSLSVTPHHESVIGNRFEIEDITYENQLTEIDAFTLLPSQYTGYKFNSEEDRLNFHRNKRAQLVTKNKCWEYENECRLFLPQPSKWISGKTEYSSFQRLLYYDFNQVVGIIFGARINPTEKENIKNILNSKLRERTSNLSSDSNKIYVFDFLYQQAEICTSSRSVKINDSELFTMGSTLSPGGDYYKRQLAKWKNFEGITIESGKYSYDPIP